MDRTVSGAFLCLLSFSPTAFSEPFNTRDQNPLALIHGLPLPTSAMMSRVGFSWTANYTITNTLNVENITNESILLDYESHEFIVNLNYGLADHWAIRLDIPLIYYGGGFLDNAIDSWHRTFGLPQADRPEFPDNAFRLNYLSGTTTVFDTDKANSSLADIQLGIGTYLSNTPHHKTSVWLSVDLPTGRQHNLTGSKKTDLILQLASQYQLNPRWLIDVNLAAILPGDSQLNSAPVASHFWSGQTGIEWRVLHALDLRMQLAGHTSIYPDSELKLLGSNYQLVFGGRIHLAQCKQFDISVSEDIKAGASPDVSFHFNYRYVTACNQ